MEIRKQAERSVPQITQNTLYSGQYELVILPCIERRQVTLSGRKHLRAESERPERRSESQNKPKKNQTDKTARGTK